MGGEAGGQVMAEADPEERLTSSSAMAGLAVDLLRRDVRPGVGGRLRQPLARALGMGKGRGGPPGVIDATAGAGMDSWLMASLGCRVVSIERSKLIFEAANEALGRAAAVLPEVARRVTQVNDDALDFLARLESGDEAAKALIAEALGDDGPAVVYLDPMFPTGRKTAEGKLLRATRAIVGDDVDGDGLLSAAFGVAARRVVVKRPRRGVALAGVEPTISHIGKGVRYDVYAKEDATVAAAVKALTAGS